MKAAWIVRRAAQWMAKLEKARWVKKLAGWLNVLSWGLG